MSYLFFGGKIMRPEQRTYEALLVNEDRIQNIGTYRDLNALTDSKTVKIDLKGKILLPGFIDTHTHFYEYAKKKYQIDLSPAKSVRDIEIILHSFKNNLKGTMNWIGGSGWNKNIYPDAELLNKQLLDKYFPDIPVALESKDFHSKLCNSAALAKACIDAKTPDPAGGKIGRFSNGEPDGFTYEKAWELIDKVAVPLSSEMQEKAVKAGVEDAWRFGLTGIHCMENKHKWNLYKKVNSQNKIMRFYWHFPSDDLDEMLEAGIKSYTGDDWLKICGMKIFMDGSLGSQSAYMYEPYPGTDSNGMVIYSEDTLYQMVFKAARAGISSSIHAIGDKCVNLVIRVLDRVNKETGTKLPHRIEHLQCIQPSDYPMLKDNEILCALQPVHIGWDVNTIKKYWSRVENQTYPFRDLLKLGIKPGFGSDAPVETLNPFIGIYAALERRIENNPLKDQWTPNQCLKLNESLKGYTIWAAGLSLSEQTLGSL